MASRPVAAVPIENLISAPILGKVNRDGRKDIVREKVSYERVSRPTLNSCLLASESIAYACRVRVACL